VSVQRKQIRRRLCYGVFRSQIIYQKTVNKQIALYLGAPQNSIVQPKWDGLHTRHDNLLTQLRRGQAGTGMVRPLPQAGTHLVPASQFARAFALAAYKEHHFWTSAARKTGLSAESSICELGLPHSVIARNGDQASRKLQKPYRKPRPPTLAYTPLCARHPATSGDLLDLPRGASALPGRHGAEIANWLKQPAPQTMRA